MRDTTLRSYRVPDEDPPTPIARAAYDTPALVILHLVTEVGGNLFVSTEEGNMRNTLPVPPPSVYVLPALGFEGFMLAPGQVLYALPQTAGQNLQVSVCKMDYPNERLPSQDQNGRFRFVGPLTDDDTVWMCRSRDDSPARVNIRVFAADLAICEDFDTIEANPAHGFVVAPAAARLAQIPILLAPRQSLYTRRLGQDNPQLSLQIRDALDEDWILDVD